MHSRCALWAAVLLILAPLEQAHSASIVNGGFEFNLNSWAISGQISTATDLSGIGGRAGAYRGDVFATFNFGIDNDGPLTQNVLSQDFEAPGDSVVFFWNRIQSNYVGDGGVTLQVAYTDLTAGATEILEDIDFAPDGTGPGGDLPWRMATIEGLTAGHMYHFEVRGGFSEGASTDNGGLIYALDAVFTPLCPPLPRSDCHLPSRSIVVLRDKTVSPPDPDEHDKVVWKWLRGEPTSQADFGVPTGTAQYALCLYAGTASALVSEANVLPDAVKWKPTGTTGYKYKDRSGSEDGIQKILLKGSDRDKTKALVKGKGANLQMPEIPLALPVRAQLLNSHPNICWEGSYGTDDIKKNEDGQFRASGSVRTP